MEQYYSELVENHESLAENIIEEDNTTSIFGPSAWKIVHTLNVGDIEAEWSPYAQTQHISRGFRASSFDSAGDMHARTQRARVVPKSNKQEVADVLGVPLTPQKESYHKTGKRANKSYHRK